MPIPHQWPDRRLNRTRRLAASRLFEDAYSRGQRAVERCLVLWVRTGPGAARRLGVVASRKIGGAVQRNRAKRRLREAFRLNRHRFSEAVDVVLVARRPVLDAPWAQVQEDLLAAARRMGVLAGAAERTP